MCTLCSRKDTYCLYIPGAPADKTGTEKGGGNVAEAVRGERTRRVQVNFSENAFEELAEIAKRRNKKVSDVVREAIAFEKWYQDTVDSGGHVLVERKDGRYQEVVRP
jgi:pyridoxal biosynthesis lyase PdxS